MGAVGHFRRQFDVIIEDLADVAVMAGAIVAGGGGERGGAGVRLDLAARRGQNQNEIAERLAGVGRDQQAMGVQIGRLAGVAAKWRGVGLGDAIPAPRLIEIALAGRRSRQPSLNWFIETVATSRAAV
ncbi:MAG TPA: hypothetical protein VMU18_13180 [Rhodoblastus sp.]|nr:hypothetical protein [Rhodoblastus sp.]